MVQYLIIWLHLLVKMNQVLFEDLYLNVNLKLLLLANILQIGEERTFKDICQVPNATKKRTNG